MRKQNYELVQVKELPEYAKWKCRSEKVELIKTFLKSGLSHALIKCPNEVKDTSATVAHFNHIIRRELLPIVASARGGEIYLVNKEKMPGFKGLVDKFRSIEANVIQ